MLISITWAQWGVSRRYLFNAEIFIFLWLFDFNFMSYFYINTLNPTENHYPQWYRKSLTSHNSGKCLWIIHPACVFFLWTGAPSLTLLYILDKTTTSLQVPLKAVGHQRYWSYEDTDRWSKSPTIRYNSYIIPSFEAPFIKFLYCDNCTWLRCRCFPL